MTSNMDTFIAFILYPVWMALGYFTLGIPGIIIGFALVFIIIRTFRTILDKDIFEGLSNSGKNTKNNVRSEIVDTDDWD